MSLISSRPAALFVIAEARALLEDQSKLEESIKAIEWRGDVRLETICIKRGNILETHPILENHRIALQNLLAAYLQLDSCIGMVASLHDASFPRRTKFTLANDREFMNFLDMAMGDLVHQFVHRKTRTILTLLNDMDKELGLMTSLSDIALIKKCHSQLMKIKSDRGDKVHSWHTENPAYSRLFSLTSSFAGAIYPELSAAEIARLKLNTMRTIRRVFREHLVNILTLLREELEKVELVIIAKILALDKNFKEVADKIRFPDGAIVFMKDSMKIQHIKDTMQRQSDASKGKL
jgi:hypothetical protein